jgi:hypothetical protein
VTDCLINDVTGSSSVDLRGDDLTSDGLGEFRTRRMRVIFGFMKPPWLRGHHGGMGSHR